MRGLGGCRQADAIPLDDYASLPKYAGKELQLAEEALLVGCWWLLREIELANVRLEDASFLAGEGCGVAVLKVPASKADAQARGASRQHGCACPSVLCPVKALRALVLAAQGEGPEAALVKDRKGEQPTKAATCREIARWAKHVNAPSGNYTGHSLRTTGAQRLALAGLSEKKIKFFGRWASDAMLRYVREKLLTDASRKVAKQVVVEAEEAAAAQLLSKSSVRRQKWPRLAAR